jgi:hypothetical protein
LAENKANIKLITKETKLMLWLRSEALVVLEEEPKMLFNAEVIDELNDAAFGLLNKEVA